MEPLHERLHHELFLRQALAVFGPRLNHWEWQLKMAIRDAEDFDHPVNY
jgi:hypothetical protein